MSEIFWEVLCSRFGVKRALEILCGLEAIYIAEQVRKQIGLMPAERLKRILKLLDELSDKKVA